MKNNVVDETENIYISPEYINNNAGSLHSANNMSKKYMLKIVDDVAKKRMYNLSQKAKGGLTNFPTVETTQSFSPQEDIKQYIEKSEQSILSSEALKTIYPILKEQILSYVYNGASFEKAFETVFASNAEKIILYAMSEGAKDALNKMKENYYSSPGPLMDVSDSSANSFEDMDSSEFEKYINLAKQGRFKRN